VGVFLGLAWSSAALCWHFLGKGESGVLPQTERVALDVYDVAVEEKSVEEGRSDH